jgi:hypothetical protein
MPIGQRNNDFVVKQNHSQHNENNVSNDNILAVCLYYIHNEANRRRNVGLDTLLRVREVVMNAVVIGDCHNRS